jgi:hypothetical protein
MTQQARCRRHGSLLDFSTDDGRLVEWCEKCDRARRGLCIDCGKSTPRKRCESCKRLRINLRVNSRRARTCWLRGCQEPVRTGQRAYRKAKRNGRLSGTWGYKTREDYLRAMVKANNHQERKEKRRAWALANQRRFNEHERLLCATRGVLIEWNGSGRPRKYCPPCHPWRKSRKTSSSGLKRHSP